MATTRKQSGFLIQSSFGTRGNLDLVVPNTAPAGGLVHYWRNNDAPGLPWHESTTFGLGHVWGMALIQSNFGSNLEVVANVEGQLVLYWRESAPPFAWHGPTPAFATGITGNPTLIQSSFGARGNFEVVVARAGGGLAHYWRDNDAPGLPWRGPINFGAGNVRGVALIQSNFGSNLEVVANVEGQLVLYWRESTPPFAWHGPTPSFGSGARNNPSLIQGSFGTRGNFDLVVPRAGGLAHYWRDNDAPGLPWRGPVPFGTGNVQMVSLIQSNFGPGNLEVVALVAPIIEVLYRNHYWRDNAPPFAWHGPFSF